MELKKLQNLQDRNFKVFNLIAGWSCLIYTPVFYFLTGLAELYLPLLLAIPFFFVSSYGYNSQHKVLLKYISLIIFNSLVFLFDIYLGKKSNIVFAYFLTAFIPLTWFDMTKNKHIISAVLLSLLSYSLSIIIIPHEGLSGINNNILNKSLALTVMLMAVFYFLTYTKISSKLWKTIQETKDSLTEDKEILTSQNIEINRKESILNSIVEGAGFLYLVAIDTDFKILNANQNFVDNCEINTVIGENIFSCIPSTQKIILQPLINTAFKGIKTTKKIQQKVEGNLKNLFLSVVPLKSVNTNEIIGASIYYSDKDDIAKIESAAQEEKLAKKSLQFKTEFLAQMSHEIRTPLNGIIGMTDVIEGLSDLNPEVKAYVEIIKSSSKELLHLINSVLELSKLEAGKVSINKEIFNPKLEIETVVNLWNATAQQKGIDLNLNYSEQIPEKINCDKGKIKQVVNNLLNNAIKFTQDGKIDINVTKENDQLLIKVSDTGIGISKMDQGKLFEKFEQIHSTVIKKMDGSTMGTGLGLPITQEIVELLGGTIEVTSTPGKGSEFTVKLPLNLSTSENISTENTVAGKSENKENKFNKHVLIVEDKQVNITVAQLLLKALGCTSDVAKNGEECLMTYKENEGKYDLILMDIQMPIMDGLTATQELKRNFTNLPPIYALSANNMEGDKEKYLSYGLDGYIAKPVNKEILINNFNQLFN